MFIIKGIYICTEVTDSYYFNWVWRLGGKGAFFQKSCSKNLCGFFPPIKSLKIFSKYPKGEMWLFSSEGMFLFGYNIKSNNKIYNIQNIRIAKIDRKMKLNFMLFHLPNEQSVRKFKIHIFLLFSFMKIKVWKNKK